MRTTSNEHLVWIDVETTGLDPYPPTYDQLLEVACIVTDTDLNSVDDGYQATIWFDAQAADAMRDAAPEVVREMHDRTGLWQRLTTTGIPKHDAESQLLEYIVGHAPQCRSGMLAGNSVALDKSFLSVHMPSVIDHLHYRILDVSTVANVARWWRGIDSTSAKAREHEAMADIRESIHQLRTLRTALNL